MFTTLVALALRLHHLDYESLFMDELRQVSNYSAGFWEMPDLAATQTQPPLDYWIGSLVTSLFGNTDFTVRLPAMVFGTASVTLMTWLCARLFSVPVGLIIGSYMALSHYLIYFSQDARPYSIAIFFFIAVLTVIVTILSASGPSRRQYLLLLVTACLFIFSRTLVPVMSMGLFVLCAMIVAYRYRDNKPFSRKLFNISLILLACIVIYMPAFMNIYAENQNYLVSGTDYGEAIARALEGMHPANLWRIIIVQAGNLSSLLLILAIAPAIYVAKRNKRTTTDLIYVYATGFLLVLFLSHMFIHYFKTSSTMRPPYAIYLLPMLAFVSAYSLHLLASHSALVQRKKLLLTLLAITFLLPQAATTYAFKNMKIKSDWRTLVALVSHRFDNRHLLLFDTLDTRDTWNPGFYGFGRYPHGSAYGIKLDLLLKDPGKMVSSGLRPVIVLFHYRNYYLTPSSQHGIMPLGRDDNPMPRIDDEHSDIDLVNLTGFSVISLKQYSDNFATDARKLLSSTIPILPDDSSSVNLRLLSILLSKEDSDQMIMDVKKLSRPSQYEIIRSVERRLKANTPYEDQRRENQAI